MIAVPAVDLKGGRCVQLVGGRPEEERVSLPDPVGVAHGWTLVGFSALHVVDLDGALAEATRCFSCGTCIQCDNCVVYCPDLAVKREGDGYVVLTDFCKGCGICVKECPTGSMKMTEESR